MQNPEKSGLKKPDGKKILIPLSALLIAALTAAAFHRTQGFYKNYHAGRRHYLKSDYSRALAYFLRALDEKPAHPEVLLHAARTRLELGEEDEAAALLEALAKSPLAGADPLEEAADHYYGMNRYGEAEDLYRRALRKKPGPRPKRKLAEVLALQGEYGEASSLLFSLLREDPGDPRVVESLADVYSLRGRHGRAAVLYRELLDAGYRERETAFKLAEALRLQQRYEESIRFYMKYLEE